MGKARNEILILQDEYLQSKDKAHIKALYLKLVNLAVAIQRRDDRIVNEDAALDVAADVCMRLIEKQEKVIGSSPSAYLRQAMYYSGKTKNHLDIDDIQEASPEVEEPEQSYEDYSVALLKRTGIDTRSEVGQLVEKTLESRIDWHSVWKSIPDPKVKVKYYRAMRSVRKNANENL